MTAKLSNAQIDKLGERLKSDPISEDDLRMIDEFTTSFTPAFETVHGSLRELGFQPTGRLKRRDSIIAKLRRGDVKSLSKMQDVAGRRVVVPSIVVQDRSFNALLTAFPGARVDDKRGKPRNGYRAVHVIPRIDGNAVEIQVRTSLQDHWANLCEKLADQCDRAIKYGGGPPGSRLFLDKLSESVALYERHSPDLRGRPPQMPFRAFRAFQAFKFGLQAPRKPTVDWTARELELLDTEFRQQSSGLVQRLKAGADAVDWDSLLEQLRTPLTASVDRIGKTSVKQ